VRICDGLDSLALSSLNLAGTGEWMRKNAKAVVRYRTWMQSQGMAR
jgi:hypothetical protein